MGSVVISQAVSDHLHRPHTMLGGSVSQTATSDSVFHTSHPPYPPPPPPVEPSVSRPSGNNPSAPSAATPSHPHRNAPAVSAAVPAATTHNPCPMTPNSSNASHHSRSRSQHPQQGADSGRPLMNDTTPHRSAVNFTPTSPQGQSQRQSARAQGRSGTASPTRIKVRDLSHIQSFASEEILGQSQRSHNSGYEDVGRQYEISAMPVQDIIEMVAGLLTKITTTNDLQHEHVHRHIPPPEGTTGLSAQTTSVLAFHGKNVPSITILSYLSRIHKYCPTTYEVFLSLLVYFDRMTEMVNKGTLQSMQQRADPTSEPAHLAQPPSATSTPSQRNAHPPVVTPPSSARMDAQDTRSPPSTVPPSLSLTEEEEENLSHFFVVDSFNIHRLVIAGVTCASKFFSDVFYTNSRYAKVASLPPALIYWCPILFIYITQANIRSRSEVSLL